MYQKLLQGITTDNNFIVLLNLPGFYFRKLMFLSFLK